MWLKNNYQKFKKHLKTGGFLYACWRGIKYFIFLIKKNLSLKQRSIEIPGIVKGKLKIFCLGKGIKIFWDEKEITKNQGLNVAINTLGLWTDSTKADWQIQERKEDYLKIKVVFEELPLNQIWKIKIENQNQFLWEIDMEIEEYLHIDEIRIVSLLLPCFKIWINNYQQGYFSRIDKNWKDLCLENLPTRLVGVRFPLKERTLPNFIMEPQNYESFFPIIQTSPLEINAYIIGFRYIIPEEKKIYTPGCYPIFSGKITLSEKDLWVDSKIENLRQELLVKKINKERKKKILLVNLPWQKNGKWGVRAGSRWPHIKDDTEGNYLPFPFFLAYATSLLIKNGIDAFLIDAIAEKIPGDKFLEKISQLDFDYLIAETSVPSFFDDLRILEKINRMGIPIILCGPNALIYQESFLKEYPFIDFVLYGEYEFTLLELIKTLEKDRDLSKIKGLIWRDKDRIIKNPKREPFDINLLPWPYREGLPMERYWDMPGNIPYPSVQMLSSRGCPFSCNFCLWPQVMYQGNHYRMRDIKDVIDEMEFLVKEKGFKSVYFDDDTFNISKERVLKFCKEIKGRDLQKTPWAIMARPDLMDEGILEELKSAGLWAVKYGVESCSQSLIKNCGKNMELEKTTQMIKITKDLGIKVHLTFCFGFDGETEETIAKTIDYALDLDPESVQFSILTPFPGTPLFEELDKEGRILTRDWFLYDGNYTCVFRPDHLSPQDLKIARDRAYILWGEHLRKKRGLKGDLKRFKQYLKNYGFAFTIWKTFDYLNYIWIKKRSVLDGKIK